MFHFAHMVVVIRTGDCEERRKCYSFMTVWPYVHHKMVIYSHSETIKCDFSHVCRGVWKVDVSFYE